MFLRTRNVPQAGKMHILSQRSRVSWNDSRKRRNTDEPCQTQSHPKMVPTGQYQSRMILPWILQLLPEIHPLLDLTKQSTPWTWRPDQEKAFQNLQATFTRQLVLAFPNTSKPFTLMTDALLTASGAVLM